MLRLESFQSFPPVHLLSKSDMHMKRVFSILPTRHASIGKTFNLIAIDNFSALENAENFGATAGRVNPHSAFAVKADAIG